MSNIKDLINECLNCKNPLCRKGCPIATRIPDFISAIKNENLEVTERHEHSNDVPYIEDGKDAAVSYNTADLKFKNTLEYDVKIEAEVKDRKVKIK